MIKQDVIDRVREQTDIVELIGSYLQLKRVGRNYRGLCPFHAERSPSFYVNPERQSYHCFGCGTGGTAFSFVMAHEKLEFPEAVRSLAKRLGIEVETEAGPGRNQPLYDAGEAVAGFFERQLGENPRAREYVARRGLRPETVKRFRLGFAPGGNRLRAEAGKLGLAEDVLVRAGVLAQRDAGLGDYFFNRVMFPVFSVGGRIVGFSGRVLDDREPKYLNSPDTPVFHKGELLYGLFQAKGYIRAQLPVLVEGNFDLLALADRGIDNVVATLGTALTPTQAATLRRFNPRVCLCYDGDQAGRKACRRALEVVLAAGIDPQVAVLPDGTDPDSYVRQN
ncbi:DNA primase, partial [candidate division WOR-3 bacterium]|nr:DNA primase [candidate division WOR-3 bacterium]